MYVARILNLAVLGSLYVVTALGSGVVCAQQPKSNSKNPFTKTKQWLVSMKKPARASAPQNSASQSFRLTDEGPQEKTDPKQTQVDLLLAMAENHESHDNFADAIKAYEEVLQLEPNVDAYHRLGMLSYKQGQEEQTWSNLKEAMKLAPKSPVLLADCGYLIYMSGDYKLAEQYTRRGLEYARNDQRLHNNLGLILTAQRRHDEALAAFKSSTNNETTAYSNLGHACLLLEQYPEAERYLKVAADGRKPDADAVKSLVMLKEHSPNSTPIVRTVSHSRR